MSIFKNIAEICPHILFGEIVIKILLEVMNKMSHTYQKIQKLGFLLISRCCDTYFVTIGQNLFAKKHFFFKTANIFFCKSQLCDAHLQENQEKEES